MMYEVWTKHENGELGVLLCCALKRNCEDYVKQAIKKGADPDSLTILIQRRFVIKREDQTEQMLMGLGIGSNNRLRPTTWTSSLSYAIHFEELEAKATIEFIQNVVDWELAEQLIIVAVED